NTDLAGFVNAGYAVMTLDAPGTGKSQGDMDIFGEQTVIPFEHTLDWVVAQPWSDGRIGLTGCSGPGMYALRMTQAEQLRVEAGTPRSILTTFAEAPPADLYRDILMGPGGLGSGFIFGGAGAISNISDLGDNPADQDQDAARLQHLLSVATGDY